MTSSSSMRKLGGAALLMTAAVALSRVIGFLRETYVAARFGASGATDAFFAAFTIPDWLNYLVAGGTLSITLLPIYSRYLAEGDEAEANRVLSTTTTVLLVVLGAGVIGAELFAGPLVDWFFHRMPPDARALCVRYTRILLPAQMFFVGGALLSATLYARGRFAAAAFAPLLYNLFQIAGGVLLGSRIGPESLAWGALVGAACGPFLVPAIAAVRAGARLGFRTDLGSPGFREWLRQTVPLMIGVSLVTADDWIIRYFAGEDRGTITHLKYAKTLMLVPVAIAGQAVGQAAMPFFARLFAEGKRGELADTFLRTVRGAATISLLAAAWLLALARPAVQLVFGRGSFGPEDVAPTALYVAIFGAAIPLWTVQGLAARVFYAARNTMTPMLVGTIVTLVSVPAYALLYRVGGPWGLSAASGLGILGHTVSLYGFLPRVLPEVTQGGVMQRELGALGRATVLAAVAGGMAWGASRLLAGHAPLLVAAAGSVAFVLAVFVMAPGLGIQEPAQMVAAVARRIRRRRG